MEQKAGGKELMTEVDILLFKKLNFYCYSVRQCGIGRSIYQSRNPARGLIINKIS